MLNFVIFLLFFFKLKSVWCFGIRQKPECDYNENHLKFYKMHRHSYRRNRRRFLSFADFSVKHGQTWSYFQVLLFIMFIIGKLLIIWFDNGWADVANADKSDLKMAKPIISTFIGPKKKNEKSKYGVIFAYAKWSRTNSNNLNAIDHQTREFRFISLNYTHLYAVEWFSSFYESDYIAINIRTFSFFLLHCDESLLNSLLLLLLLLLMLLISTCFSDELLCAQSALSVEHWAFISQM